jgi:hypothetical protein
MPAVGFVLAGLVVGGPVLTGSPSTVHCAVTKPEVTQPARDAAADPFPSAPWYINADRTIWAGWDAANLREGRNKVLWIRPKGTQLEISGRRLDSESSPLVARIPCCYPTGFQASGLTFPTGGCWEVRARAGASELTFVTFVKPQHRPEAGKQ